jgi:ADP-ribose pyrophosphatase YjhB (NUDIX family)
MIKIAHYFLKLIWKITKPTTVGARIILMHDKKVLLVKHTYQNQYFLPGGMMKSGETLEQAAIRELKEETGYSAKDLKLFGVYNNFQEYKNDTIVVFETSQYDEGKNNDLEIESWGFFDLECLPNNISPGTKRRIEEYLLPTAHNFGKW